MPFEYTKKRQPKHDKNRYFFLNRRQANSHCWPDVFFQINNYDVDSGKLSKLSAFLNFSSFLAGGFLGKILYINQHKNVIISPKLRLRRYVQYILILFQQEPTKTQVLTSLG